MSHSITYLALSQPGFAVASRTISAFREICGEMPFEIEVLAATVPGNGYILLVNGLAVTVMFVDAALPRDVWGAPVARDIVWPEAASVMQGHAGHVIVALLTDAEGHPDTFNAAMAVTLVSAAVAQCLAAKAAIFTDACSILEGGAFIAAANELKDGNFPDLFWMTLTFHQENATTFSRPVLVGMTTGLAPFVGREIELHVKNGNLQDIASRLFNLGKYLIVNGPVIRDGETVGYSEQEKIKVKYLPAGLRAGVPIMRMSIEQA